MKSKSGRRWDADRSGDVRSRLGVSRETIRLWVRALGAGVNEPPGLSAPAREPESDTGRIARLEAELAAERAEVKKLATERDILTSAAKYLAGETRW